MRNKPAAIVLLLLAASTALPALPGTIEGVVTDSERHALAGAQVWLEEQPVGAATDAAGRYRIEVPVAGTFRVVYQFVGFESETLVVTVMPDERVTRNVALRPTAIRVPGAEARASRPTVHETKTPEPTAVIPKAAAEKAGKTTIGEAATLETGVQLQKRCSACEASEVSIHGLPGRFSLILLDGTPMFSNLASRYILDMLPVEFLDRLEVLKGASGAIWGSDAIAGAINILPYQPAKPLEARASYTRHSFGNDVSVLAGSNRSPLGMSIVGAHGDRGFVDLNSDSIAENTAYNRNLLLASLNFAPDAQWLFSGGAAFGDELRRGGAIVPDTEYLSNPMAEKVHSRRWDGWQRTSFAFADNRELRLRLALSRYDEHSVVEMRDYSAGQTSGYSELSLSLPRVRTGMSFSGQAVTDSRLFSEGYTETDFAGWVAGQNLATEVLRVPVDFLPALRVDAVSGFGIIASPFAAVKLYPALVDLNFAAGTGFRTPTVILESMENLPAGYQYAIRRDSNLTRESGFSLVAGAGRRLVSPKLVTELRLNLFYHRVGNFITADLVGLDSASRRAVFHYRNLDETMTSTGAEVSASFAVMRGITANLGAYVLE
ncbi:MAG: TonB-dependent receptor, partial [candidate division WOR-3 bacterium]